MAVEARTTGGARRDSSGQTGTFVRKGEYWTLGCDGGTFSLRDTKGLSYLQFLLLHPSQEFHALDLARQASGAIDPEEVTADTGTLLGDPTVQVGGLGDAGELLDERAKREYRQKLVDLREELAELRERGDVDGAAKVESEIEFLAHEISRAVGLGGRDRHAASVAERARLNVTRAIKSAIQKISEHHAPLGELFNRSIKTGTFCSYTPDSRKPIAWQFSLGSPDVPSGLAATRELSARSRKSIAVNARDRTAFVGREAELAILRRFLDGALAGEGKVVLIEGPPGVGKTRLATEIWAQAAGRGALTLAGACYDRDDSVPFLPFVEILEAALASTPDLDSFRTALGTDAQELARLLPQLTRIFPDIPPPLDLPPAQSRRVLFHAVRELLVRTVGNRPVVLLLDDLHWADEGTLALLSYLVQPIAEMTVLILGTYRDFELDPTGALARTIDELIRAHLVERITVAGLTRTSVADMLRALSGREPPQELASFFYSETQGNPFFVEELFRHLVEQGKLIDSAGEFRRSTEVAEVDLPESLRLIIGRRLGRVRADTHKMLGTAAVIGRAFSFEFLQAATQADPASLLDCVEEADRAGLFRSTGKYPDVRFEFSHELIRQTVISSLSAPRRQRLHLDVARAIERANPNSREDEASDLAHHCFQAGALADVGTTVGYLALAARQAMTRSANLEATAHLSKAVKLLNGLPESLERNQQELGLQLGLGMALILAKGYSDPEVQRAFTQAEGLCARLGETPDLYPALWGLWSYYLVRGDYQASHKVGQRLFALAEKQNDSDLLLEAHTSQGLNFLNGGCDLELARTHFESALRIYDYEQHFSHASRYSQDPGIVSLGALAWTLWLQGYPDQALAKHEECLKLARRRSHDFSLAWGLGYGASFRQFRREVQIAKQLAEEGIAFSNEHGFPIWALAASFSLGWALNQSGQAEKAVELLQAVTTTWHAMGAQITRPHQLGLLADALGRANQVQKGLMLLEEALDEARATGEEYYEAELYRLKGELLLKLDQSALTKAESGFRQSLEVARRQGAKSWELRTAMSLMRLERGRGPSEESRRMLADIYGRFTEGFDTPDLRDAKTLLAENGS